MYALLAAFILAATPAWAQKSDHPVTHQLVDKNGAKAGTVTISGNRQFLRDINDELIATIVIEKDGTRTAYDPDGKVLKSDKLPVPR